MSQTQQIIDFSHVTGREPEQQQSGSLLFRAKWKHSGIYAMVVDNKVIYVGKSKDMSVRIMQHIWHPDDTKKYWIIDELIAAGYRIEFVPVEYCEVAALTERESYWINYYLPPLNYQIPKHQDFKKQKSLLKSVESYEDALRLAKNMEV